MHDIDNTLTELELEGEEEFEWEDPDIEPGEFEGSNLFDEAEEMEMASDLLNVSSDQELEMFLGKLFRKVSRGVRRVIRSPVGRALGGVLKRVAKRALPIAGAALGNLVAPGIGGVIGGKLASGAGRIFGLELEGLSPEDQEFEAARRFVRLAADAAAKAAAAPAAAHPTQVARAALASAARKHAPGLLGGTSALGGGRSGRWVRRGRNIVVMGA